MKEWDQDAVKVVINTINQEIKMLKNFNCYHCKDFPMDFNSNNETCNFCRQVKKEKIQECDKRLALWKNRLIKEEGENINE